MDKIIITSDEIEKSDNLNKKHLVKSQVIPLWWRLLSGLFIMLPPVLFLITIIGLIINRRKYLSVRYAHSLHYCWLLLISGIIWMFLGILLKFNVSSKLQRPFLNETSISLSATPSVLSKSPFSGKEIASEFSPMVIAIHKTGIEGITNDAQIYGAGVIVNASKEGCLILTSKHVTDAVSYYQDQNQIVSISLRDNQKAIAKVVGMHLTLDLSLLWVRRVGDKNVFQQSIRKYNTVEVGETVFVIGHPEGLEFSISNGLVAQKWDEELIQISAPISPGNSGGPVYDDHGNLIGIVQSGFDKEKLPNAENLNFAVRADVLVNPDTWSLLEEGAKVIATFSLKNNNLFD